MKPKRKQAFDCVAFKRRIQSKIYAEIRCLKPTEEIAYFRRTASRGPLGSWWASFASHAAVAEQTAPYRT